jgi:hypothetical protein
VSSAEATASITQDKCHGIKFLISALQTAKNVFIHFKRKFTRVRVHRNIKTIPPHFKVIMPWCPRLEKEEIDFL